MKRFRNWLFSLVIIGFVGGLTVAGNWEPRLEHYNLPFQFDVARGAVPGVTWERKFGSIDSLTADTPTDVWQYGETTGAEKYTWSTTADIDRISSSSIADTGITAEVKGLDVDGYEVTQSITLNGQTPVPLTTSLWRLNRIQNDNGTDYQGNIYVFVNGATTGGVPDDVTSVRGFIEAGDNQTLQTIYTVLKGKTAYILGSEVSITKTGGVAAAVDFKTKIRTFGGVFKTKYNYSLSTSGTSRMRPFAQVWAPFPELTDVEPGVVSSANGVGASFAFTILLVNN